MGEKFMCDKVSTLKVSLQLMTVEELEDEVGAIDAIYPESVKKIASQIYQFTIPDEGINLQMSFPEDYPDVKPHILQVIATNTVKYPDTSYIEDQFNKALDNVFNEGEVVVFELFSEIEQFLTEYKESHPEPQHEDVVIKKLSEVKLTDSKTKPVPLVQSNSTQVVIDPLEGWVQSDPIVDRGSTFIAYVREVHSVEEAQENVDLLITDKKIAKSAHNMSAWRIKKENGVQYQDCDDDGETAAGGRLLHLLTVCWTKK